MLFLDDGGVMNDNTVRGPQWERLVGEFFPPILGGSSEAWAEANRAVATALLEPAAWLRRLDGMSDYATFLQRYRLDWMTFMCEMVGVPVLADVDALELSERAERWIMPRVDAAFPGAVEAIRTLHAQEYRLFTASGEPSSDLHDYLSGMGVRDCFERLYGPDLIDTFKNGPEYYQRIFAGAGVEAGDAIVVDDSPAALGWASAVGATSILVGAADGASPGTMQIGSLRELPDLLATMHPPSESGDLARGR